jgi:glycosyltransferase involved in cell wall biosynthesis
VTSDPSSPPGPASPPIRVLLTVPHLNALSPYREMMALAALLPRDRIHLTVCSLRRNGLEETGLALARLGIPVTVTAFRPRARTMRALLDSLRAQAALSRMGPFDLQHSLDFTSSPFEALMARLHGRAFVFTQRDLNQDGHALFLILKIRLATAVIAISTATRRVLSRHGARQRSIAAIPNGLCLEDFPFAFRDTQSYDGPVILSVGHIVRLKRHEDAIRAFATLAGDMPRARLRIVGPVFDHAYFEALSTLANGLGLSQRIDFAGERADVNALMHAADVLLFCSESEGLPWVLLEAMALGLPIVSSDAEGPREILEDSQAGVVVRIGDITGYSAGLQLLLQDRQAAKAMAVRARAVVEERFNATVMVKDLAALYLTVLKRS